MTDDEELLRLSTEVATLRSALKVQMTPGTTSKTAAGSKCTCLLFAGLLIGLGAVFAPICVVTTR